MMLNVHLPGAASYDVGDEIWQEPIADAIRAEAEMIADYAGPDLLEPVRGDRGTLRERIVAEMSAALVNVADSHRALDGVLYTLTDEPEDELRNPAKVRRRKLVVTEVLRFEELAPGSLGSRRAVVRWSDGSESEGLRWYSDEVLICALPAPVSVPQAMCARVPRHRRPRRQTRSPARPALDQRPRREPPGDRRCGRFARSRWRPGIPA